MTILSPRAAILALALVAACTSGAEEPVKFSAMGCGPYLEHDWDAIRDYLKRENDGAGSEFLIHLGDVIPGKTSAAGIPLGYCRRIAELFSEGNQIPTYFVPGDNEWNDSKDPKMAWSDWSANLMRFDERTQQPWKTRRQAGHPENFAFDIRGIRFIGINLVGGKVHDAEEWKLRHADNVGWIRENLLGEENAGLRGSVVMCQANPSKPPHQDFVRGFVKAGSEFKRPLLFLHADGHKWTLDQPWKAALNIQRVQVDVIGAKFPPIQVIAGGAGPKFFQFDRRLKDGGWLKKKDK